MLRAHKIKLTPTIEQVEYFNQACGVARHAYNWALNEWQKQHSAGLKPSEAALRRQYNAIKPIEFPWSMEVTKCASQQAIKNLGTAYKNAFRRIKEGKKGAKIGFPTPKKKGIHDSFRADNGSTTKPDENDVTKKIRVSAVEIDGKTVKLPKIGWIKMRENVRFDGVVVSTSVSKQADGWYISLQIETDDRLVRKDYGSVGVDLGVKTLAVMSTGEVVPGTKSHKVNLKRLKRLNQSLSRKKIGSANRAKAKTKLGNLHKRIADIRKNDLHKLTHKLSTEFDIIGIENLNVKGMVANGKLARAVSDQGFFEFRRQLEYKALMTGSNVVVADRFYPSTKTCCECGQIHDMPLKKRVMDCDCGNVIDRDLNAAKNLEKLAVSSTVIACGESSSGADKLAV